MAGQIILLGRIPSKKNSKTMICRGRFPMLLPSQRYVDWHKDATKQLLKKPLPDIIEMTILFYLPDARRTDLTNKAESIMDLLVDNGIIADDNWNIVPRLILDCKGIDRLNPRAEITWQEKNLITQ